MDPALEKLAALLKLNQRFAAAPMVNNQPPPTPPVTIQPSAPPPTPPSTVQASASGAGLGAMLGQAVGGGMPPVRTPPTIASPPPVIAPGDQTLPSTMTRSATAADASNPIANGPNTPGFWERINQAMKAQQVPNGYRGVMGEQISNG